MRSETLIDSYLDTDRMKIAFAIPVLFVGVLLLMAMDEPIAHFVKHTGLSELLDNYHYSPLGWYIGRAMRQPGEWWPTVLAAGFFTIFHKQTWRAGGMMLLAFVPGAFNGVLKWAAGSARPFTGHEAWDWEPFRGGLAGMFNQQNLSFASGHATLAFAWAATMSLGLPRFKWLFYTLATLCGMQRVLSADHYLMDVLVGAVLGVVTVRVMFRILCEIIPPAKEVPDDPTPLIMASQKSGTQPHDRPHLPNHRPDAYTNV